MNDLLDSLLSSFLRLQSSLFSSHMSVRNARRLWLLSLMHHRGVQREHINLFRIESGLGISTRVTMAAAHGGSLSHTDTRIRKGVECVRGRGYFIGSALNDPAVRRYLWAATTADPKKQREKKKKNEGIILARLRKGRDINKMVEKSGNHRERERQEESEKKEESAPNDFGH